MRTGVSPLKFAVILTLLCVMNAASAWGQATAQIHGTVQDTSGAFVPDAQVKATQTDKGQTRTTTTQADGSYVLTDLPLGPYIIEVSKTGFTTAQESGIVLTVSSAPTVNVTLQVGAVAQTVSVEANAVQVETTSMGVATTLVDTQKILELPLNGRNVTDLIPLSGLSVQTGTSPGYNMPGGVNISVAGGLSFGVQYNLDGASHLDTYDGTNMPLPFPDALQEFRIVTSSQDASGGGHRQIPRAHAAQRGADRAVHARWQHRHVRRGSGPLCGRRPHDRPRPVGWCGPRQSGKGQADSRISHDGAESRRPARVSGESHG